MRIRRGHAFTFTALLLVAIASVAFAQGFYRVPEGYGVPVRTPPMNFEDGGFTACKLMYTSSRREAGGTRQRLNPGGAMMVSLAKNEEVMAVAAANLRWKDYSHECAAFSLAVYANPR